MDPIKNFAEAVLVAGIAAGDTAAAVGAGEAGDLPTGGQWSGVIWNFSDYGNDRVAAYKNGQAEVVGVTRTGVDLALVRAQDGTIARDFNVGGKTYKIAQDLTAGLFAKLAPKEDAALTGNTSYERMSPLIHVHADIASGTLTLHATKANNRVTLTGTAMTVAFPAGDPRIVQTLLVTNSNGSDAAIDIPPSRSLNSNATIDSFTLPAGNTALLTWYHDGTTYFLLGETLTPSQVKVALALVAADLTDFASAARAQVEAMLVQSTNITLTPSGSGASRQIAVSATGSGGSAVDGSIQLWLRADAGSIPAGWVEVTTVADYEELMFIQRDTAAPTLSSATIPSAGNVINLVFSKAVKAGAGGNGGFTIAMSGGAVTLTYSSGLNTSTLVYSLSRTVNSGETCSDFDFTQPGNGIESLGGTDLATFTNQQASVTNSSTVSAFTAKTALMSSSNYARRTTAPTGLADSAVYTLSCFVEFTGGDGVDQTVFDISNGTAAKLRLRKTSVNALVFDTWSPGGSPLATITTSGTVTVASGRVHIFVCVNQASTSATKFYVNGTNVRTDSSIGNGAACDLVPSAPKYSFARNGGDTSPASVRISEFWFDDVYLDAPASFASGSTPIDIGATGSTPTGSAPAFYFSRNGDANAWAVDSSGNGNDLTVTGTLGT